MYFDMVPEHTISKKGIKEVRVCSSGGEKRKLTVALSCTANGKMLPALAIFKGKRKLKFKAPQDVYVTVQAKGWMDTELMHGWFRAIILPYTKKRRTLLVIDSFSAYTTEEFLEEAKANMVDVVIIPGGCTSKVQPLDVCLNMPFKNILQKKWVEYIESQVEANPNLDKLVTASKEKCCEWIKDGQDYLKDNEAMVKKSFLVCGINNALNGSENHLIRCSDELPDLQLPYVDESDDPFCDEDSSISASDATSGDETD